MLEIFLISKMLTSKESLLEIKGHNTLAGSTLFSLMFDVIAIILKQLFLRGKKTTETKQLFFHLHYSQKFNIPR